MDLVKTATVTQMFYFIARIKDTGVENLTLNVFAMVKKCFRWAKIMSNQSYDRVAGVEIVVQLE